MPNKASAEAHLRLDSLEQDCSISSALAMDTAVLH